VTFGSYARYLIYHKRYWMVPVMLTLFLCAEACNTGFIRVLAYYDATIQGRYTLTADQFWMTLGMLHVGFFTILVLKYYTLNLVALQSI
jgi:hypothetical protein